MKVPCSAHAVNAPRHFQFYLIANRSKNIMEAVIADMLHPLISKNNHFCCMRSKTICKQEKVA